MILTRVPAGESLISPASSKPSISGICMSSRTRRKGSAEPDPSRGLAAPGPAEIGQHLPLAWKGVPALSDMPWGHDLPSPSEARILFFQDCREEVWTLATTGGELRSTTRA